MAEAVPQPFIRPEEFWHDLDLHRGETVVHLGCGAGYYLVPAAKIVGPAGKVFGVDIRTEMVEEAAGRAERAGVEDTVRTLRADLENKPGSSLAARVADWTLVANILYQADPEKIMREAARVTKHGGTIVVVEWTPAATPLGPPAADRISQRDVLAIAAKFKLELRQEFTPSPYHYGILLEA
jgi:ubiquinone/menaquinone biosynthesis C-methylase UbiE